MTPNDDALRCAEYMENGMGCGPTERHASTHIRRLVAENEAQAALLRQALSVIENYPFNDKHWQTACQPAIAAIRQHLEGKA